MSVQVAPIFSRGLYGAASAPVQPLSNLSDGNPATVADFPGTAGEGYVYLIADLVNTRNFDRLELKNVSLTGGQAGVAFSVAVDVSDVYSETGIPGDTPGGRVYQLQCQQAQSNPVTSEDLVFAPASGTVAQGRYAYVSYTSTAQAPPNPPSMTIGEAAIYVDVPPPVLSAFGLLLNNVPQIQVSGN